MASRQNLLTGAMSGSISAFEHVVRSLDSGSNTWKWVVAGLLLLGCLCVLGYLLGWSAGQSGLQTAVQTALQIGQREGRAAAGYRSTQQMLCSRLPCNVSTKLQPHNSSQAWRVFPPSFVHTDCVPKQLASGEVNIDMDIIDMVQRAKATDLQHLPFTCHTSEPLLSESSVERAFAEGGITKFLRYVALNFGEDYDLQSPEDLVRPAVRFPEDRFPEHQYPLVREYASSRCTTLYPDEVCCMRHKGSLLNIFISTKEIKKVSLEEMPVAGHAAGPHLLSELSLQLQEGFTQLYTYMFLGDLRWGILTDYRRTYLVHVKCKVGLKECNALHGDQIMYISGPYRHDTQIDDVNGYICPGPQNIPTVAVLAYAQMRGMQDAWAPVWATGSSLFGGDGAGPSGVMPGTGPGDVRSGAGLEADSSRPGGSSGAGPRRSSRIADRADAGSLRRILVDWESGTAEPPSVSVHELHGRQYIAEGASGPICPGTVCGEAAAIKYFKQSCKGAAQQEANAYLQVQPAWGKYVPKLLYIGCDAGDNLPFLAVQFIQGLTLAELKEQGRLDPPVCEAAFRALDALHHCNVQAGQVRLHGDIRLENLILQQQPTSAASPASPKQPVCTSRSNAAADQPPSPMSPMHSSAGVESQLAPGSVGAQSSSSPGSNESTTPGGSPAESVLPTVFLIDLERSWVSTWEEIAMAERTQLEQLLAKP